MFKKTLSLALFLAIVAGVAGTALSLTNNLTAPVIAANEAAKEQASLASVLPGASFEPVTDFKDDTGMIAAVYKASSGEYVYKVEADGFGGKDSITFLVAFDKEGTIKGYTVVTHSETKGVGSQVAEEKFYGQMIGQKDPSGVQLISGATISSRAVRNALVYAAEHFAANYKG